MELEKLIPKSEKTVIKHHYNYNGLKFINDLGHPCEYRVVGKKEYGMVKYYRGSMLMFYPKA